MAALHMKEYDFVSPDPEIDLAYAAKLSGSLVGECFIDHHKHAQALNAALNRHEVDGLYINLSLDTGSVSKKTDIEDGWRVIDTCGAEWIIGRNEIGAISKYPVQSLDAPLLYEAEPAMFGNYHVLDEIDARWLNEKMICCGLTGAFSQVVFLYGLENTLIAMIEEQEELERAIEARLKKAIKYAQTLSEHGARFIWIGEGAASSSVISPEQYERFVLPYEKALIKKIREELEIPVITHICGDINKSIARIAQNGSNGLDIDYMVELNYARAQTNGTVCLKGNLNPAELLRFTPGQTYEACAEKIRAFRYANGLILSTGCLVCRDTPPENIDAIVNACRDNKLS